MVRTWQNSDNGFEKDSKWWPWSTGHLQTPSNVTRIARAISRYHNDGRHQIVYYQAGVGTGGSAIDRIAGGATGEGLSEHIRESYAFLANNYQEADENHLGDEIYLIGFSRGAFTARSIGGLIGEIGILTKEGMSNFYNIFKDYETSYDDDWVDKYRKTWPNRPFEDVINIKDKRYGKKLEHDKLTRVSGVKIAAVAVWDTVGKTTLLDLSTPDERNQPNSSSRAGSLGIPKVSWLPGASQANKEYSFHDTSLSDVIENAFQALALDEKRPPFGPAVWEKPDDVNTNLVQVWFPGVHSNIGGGNDDQGIADITLAWMMSQLKDMITFDEKYLELQYSLTKKWETDKFGKEREWGLGYIEDSSTGLMTLAGGEVRTPGRYMRVDPITHRPTNTPLQNTNEYIHASARIRLGLRNAPGVSDKIPYKCPALDGWNIRGIDVDGDGVVDRGVDGQGIEWVYSGGKGKGATGMAVTEAELGALEKDLLWHFGDIAGKVMKVKPDGTFVVHDPK